jgi:hypothetical protein
MNLKPQPLKAKKAREERGFGGEEVSARLSFVGRPVHTSMCSADIGESGARARLAFRASRVATSLSQMPLECRHIGNTHPGDQACQRQADSGRESAEPASGVSLIPKANEFQTTAALGRRQREERDLGGEDNSTPLPESRRRFGRRPVKGEVFFVWSSCSGSCPRSTTAAVTPVRLPDLGRGAHRSVATSCRKWCSNKAQPITPTPGDQACQRQADSWCASTEPRFAASDPDMLVAPSAPA